MVDVLVGEVDERVPSSALELNVGLDFRIELTERRRRPGIRRTPAVLGRQFGRPLNGRRLVHLDVQVDDWERSGKEPDCDNKAGRSESGKHDPEKRLARHEILRIYRTRHPSDIPSRMGDIESAHLGLA